MKNKFKYRGTWWLSEEPNLVIPGELEINSQSVNLTLDSSFRDVIMDSLLRKVTIHGITNDRKEVTLIESFEYKRGGSGSSFKIKVAIIGKHLSIDSKYEQAYFKFPILLNWLGVHPIRSKLDSIEFQPPFKELVLVNNSNIRRSVSIGHDLNTEEHKSTISSYGGLVVENSNKMTIQEIYHELNLFRKFLTLNCLNEVSMSKAQIKEEKEQKRSFELFFSDIPYSDKSLDRTKILFGQKSYGDSFNTVISNFYRKHEKLTVIVNLLVDEIHRNSQFDESNFLNIIRGIEVFHRRFRSPEIQLSEDHKSRMESILNSCPQEYQKWLKGELSFSHEPKLKQRLREVLRELNSKIFDLIIEDSETFIKDVVNSRNYFTHYDLRSKNKAKFGAELYDLYHISKFILVGIIFVELGMPIEKVTEILHDKKNTFFAKFYE